MHQAYTTHRYLLGGRLCTSCCAHLHDISSASPDMLRRHINGHPGEPPVRPNISLGDTLAGLHGAFGAVMALLHRQRHLGHVPGQGQPRFPCC